MCKIQRLMLLCLNLVLGCQTLVLLEWDRPGLAWCPNGLPRPGYFNDPALEGIGALRFEPEPVVSLVESSIITILWFFIDYSYSVVCMSSFKLKSEICN